jgi:hypothetical protein
LGSWNVSQGIALNADDLRARIFEKLRNGTLLREPGTVAAGARLLRGQPCSACDEANPTLTLRYSSGATSHFHGLCYRIWDDERRRRR